MGLANTLAAASITRALMSNPSPEVWTSTVGLTVMGRSRAVQEFSGRDHETADHKTGATRRAPPRPAPPGAPQAAPHPRRNARPLPLAPAPRRGARVRR